MHIVIPMSGIGKRFLDAGYLEPKPLIMVEGRPIIAHVVDMFPGESKFTFICNEEHLKLTNMRTVLLNLVPNANIVSIEPHKLGPVYAVSQVYALLDDSEEVIVNYCDFGKDWDYFGFLADVRSNNSDGAISAYRGFHPHMLGTINYAFMRESDHWMLEIQEKKPFTNDRMSEFASDGTYYFKTGAILKKYFNQTMEKDISLNGEYYVSVVYNLLVQDQLKIRIFEIDHMLQWGTPGELKEYEYWSKLFKSLANHGTQNRRIHDSVNLIPMAGRGSRFAEKGFVDPKPLLLVDGEPMVVHAAKYLPLAKHYVFVCLSDHLKRYPIEKTLSSSFDNVKIEELSEVTEGQAITASIGLKNISPDLPLFIAASDNGMLYNEDKLFSLIGASDPDIIAFTFSGNPTVEKNPKMYGWIDVEGDDVKRVSVKVPLSDHPIDDHAIVGAFYFKSGNVYLNVLNELIKRNDRINNEFYIDSMVGIGKEIGFKVKVFKVDQYLCWGTPDDYHTYFYWQSFFRKVSWHPYQ
jgi:NDP-sugar pyrophosphorylase family protein